MSYRRSIEQLRPARTQKIDLQEKVQSFLTEAAMKRDDFFKRDNQTNFVKKAAAGQIVGKDGKVADTFASFTKPSSKKFLNLIEKEIKN